jgi:hypothetical protein
VFVNPSSRYSKSSNRKGTQEVDWTKKILTEAAFEKVKMQGDFQKPVLRLKSFIKQKNAFLAYLQTK